jgi:cell cycle arrest protein BUB3
MDVTSNNKVIVGTAGRHIWVWDLRRMAEPEQRRESSLKYQTRCVKAFPDGTGFALSSIEARVAVEYFDPAPEVQAQKYAFKCHRHKNAEGIDIAYPVNDIAFHPTFVIAAVTHFACSSIIVCLVVWAGSAPSLLVEQMV